MEFREHPKAWEDFLTNKEILSKVDYAKMEAVGFDFIEYQKIFKRTLKTYSDVFWKFCLDYNWLMTRFKYQGHRMTKRSQTPGLLNLASAILMRNMIGIYPKFFLGFNRPMVRSVATYIDEFFPEFDEFSPLDYPEKYPFPYANLTCDFLVAAWEIDERIPLLEKANREKMTFAVFFDFLLNHCFSVNEEKGFQYYKFNLEAHEFLGIFKAKIKKRKK